MFGRTTAVAIFIAIAASQPAIAASQDLDLEEQIGNYCAFIWQDHRVGRSNCITDQINAANRIADLRASFDSGSADDAALLECARAARNRDGGFDYVMILHCLCRSTWPPR